MRRAAANSVKHWLAITAGVILLARGLAGRVAGQNSAPPELAAAQAVEKAGRYDEAARYYRRFLAAESSPRRSAAMVEARTGLARAYFMLRRYDASLRVLAALPFENTGSGPALPASAWLVRGLDNLQLNQLPEAVRSLRAALALDPASGTARLALGDALARSGRLEAAAEEYREQLRRTPQVADAWYKLGVVYDQLVGKLSAEFFRQHPPAGLAARLTAEQRLDRGDDWGAARALLPVLQSPHPANSAGEPGLHAELGTALLRLGYPNAAAEEFKAEIARDPESFAAWWGMAEVAGLQGQWDDALHLVARLAALNPRELSRHLESPPPPNLRDAWAQRQAALPASLARSAAGRVLAAWFEPGGLPSAPRFLDPATGRCPAPLTEQQRQPGYELSESCYAALRTDLEAGKIRNRRDAAKLLEADYRLGDYEQAWSRARRFRDSLATRSPWASYWLIRSSAALAGQCFDHLAALGSDSPRVHQVLARYYSDHHQFSAARREYETALTEAPDLPDLHLGLGTLYWQEGDWGLAEEQLSKTLQLVPASAVASYELGDSYLQQHRWREAKAWLRAALAEPALAYQARLDLAKAEAGLGEDAAAIADLLALASEDRDGEVHYRLAMLYRQRGQTAKARAAIEASEALRRNSDAAAREQLKVWEERLAKLSAPQPAAAP